MLVTASRTLVRRSREGFTLLEVLVVVAILVILASVAGVYVFKYLEDARVDTARNQMTIFENACKSYMIKNEGQPPDSLEALVTPESGQPFIDGGAAVLTTPWGGRYTYQRDNVDAYQNPDPIVSVTGPDGKVHYSTRRKGVQ